MRELLDEVAALGPEAGSGLQLFATPNDLPLYSSFLKVTAGKCVRVVCGND